MIQFDIGGLFAQFIGMKLQPRMGQLETVQKPDGLLAVGTGLRPEDIGMEAELSLRIYGMPERRIPLVLGRHRQRAHGADQKGNNEQKLIPPLCAALVALILTPAQAPLTAYVSGTMGTLIGADLLNLHRIAGLRAPVASIGGAGTFDGIFVTGIVAVLLA
jgi:hypothetical protein